MSQKTTDSNNHLLFLDGLRAVAAIFVVMHHAIIQTYFFDTKNLSGFKKAFISIFFQGHFSVDLFIVLSGFCLMMPVVKADYQLKGGAVYFYKKRVVRIVPTYYIAILFSLILINFFINTKTGTHWDASIPVNVKDILADLIFIQDIFTTTVFKINHVFWSIGVETRIYVLFPLLIILYKKTNAAVTLLASSVLAVILFFIIKQINTVDNIIPAEVAGLSPYIILFTIGMISADLCFAKNPKYNILITFPWKTTLVLLSLLFMMIIKLIHTNIISWQIGDIIVGVWAMNLLIVCYNESILSSKFIWIKNFFSWKPLVFVGTFAYSLYLTHAPLLQIITQYLISPLHLTLFNAALLTLIVSLPVCVGFAYLFFLLFEKPFLIMGKKVTIKQAAKSAAVNPAI